MSFNMHPYNLASIFLIFLYLKYVGKLEKNLVKPYVDAKLDTTSKKFVFIVFSNQLFHHKMVNYSLNNFDKGHVFRILDYPGS